jgi:hypothetical protein
VAQADVAVSAARVSAAAIRLLVFVICGTPRDLSSPKAVCGVSAVNLSQFDAFTLVHSNRLGLRLSTGSCRIGWVCRTPSPDSRAASDPLKESYRPRRDIIGTHLVRKYTC